MGEGWLDSSWLSAEVRRGGGKGMVIAKFWTGRTTTLYMLSEFCKPTGMNQFITGDTHGHSDPARRWGIGYNTKDKVADIRVCV